MKKILIVDEYKAMPAALYDIISETLGTTQIRQTATIARAGTLSQEQPADLMIADIPAWDEQRMKQLLLFKEKGLVHRLLIFGPKEEERYALRCIQVGADGYLSKKSSYRDYEKALNTLFRNEKYVSRKVYQHVLLQITSDQATIALGPLDSLSPREREVALLLMAGKWAKDIAEELSLDESTIRTLKRRILSKTATQSISELTERFEHPFFTPN